MQIFLTLINLLIFISLIFLTIYPLGLLILFKVKKYLNEYEIISLSFCLGVVSFVLMATLLGVLNFRFLMLPLLFIVTLATFYIYGKNVFLPWKRFVENKILIFLIVTGILVQGFINFPSGFLYQDGLLFWSSQGHDGLWHVSLMEEISRNFPPQNPIFAGEGLYNYHFAVDILMGEFYRIFSFFTSLDLYFRFFPVLLSFMIGISVFSFVNRWQRSKAVAYLAVCFTYFVGSFGYLVTFIKSGQIFGGETVFWAAQGNTILGNPPHAISYALLPAFFLLFAIYLKTRTKYLFALSFFIASILAGFKVSGGVVMLAGIMISGLVDLSLNKNKGPIILAILLSLTNYVTFKAMTRGGESFLMFLPWWFVRTMVVAGNRLGWIDLENQRQHYLSKGTWNAYLRVGQVEMTAFLIFLIGNCGTRTLGFIELFRKMKIQNMMIFIKNPLDVLLFVSMWTGFLVPMLFVQRGIIYNNIQFMQYFLLILGFFAAIAAYNIHKSIKNIYFKFVLVILLVVFSVPTVIGNFVEFYGRPPLAKISNQELEALAFLKNNSSREDVILNMPFNKYLNGKFDKQPWPIYVWYSTSYIPALTARRTYLSSEEQALITGYPLEGRLEKMRGFFSQKDLSKNRQFLKEENIKYIYLAKKEIEIPILPDENNLKTFFENDEIIIYTVNK